MDIISRSHREHVVEYRRSFEWPGEPGCGFSFDCDEHGNVDVASLPKPAQESYAECTSGATELIDRGVQTYRRSYFVPAIGRCSCGAEVELAHFTNTCECGADYNMSGQLLAPREQWGAETGEHWTECY